MLRRLSFFIVCGLAALILTSMPASALDEDAESLQFLPSDAPLVMALDIDEITNYANDVGDNWRDADVARFIEGLGTISNMLTSMAGKPDVLTYFGNLAGVQAFSIDPMGGMPLMVFTADSQTDARMLGYYTIAYVQERRLDGEGDRIHLRNPWEVGRAGEFPGSHDFFQEIF